MRFDAIQLRLSFLQHYGDIGDQVSMSSRSERATSTTPTFTAITLVPDQDRRLLCLLEKAGR
jgi:hypothetical protein